MVSLNVAKYALVAASLILFGLFAKRAYAVGIGPAATETAVAVGTFGQGIGSVGGGIQALGEGIGTGISKLFNPLFTLRDLIFPDLGGNQPAALSATEGMSQGVREMNSATTMMDMPTAAMMPTAQAPAPVTNQTPIGLTVQQAQKAYNLGAVTIGINKPATAKQISTIFTPSILQNQQTQLYVNQRNELVRLRPTSASTLLQRGYLKAL